MPRGDTSFTHSNIIDTTIVIYIEFEQQMLVNKLN